MPEGFSQCKAVRKTFALALAGCIAAGLAGCGRTASTPPPSLPGGRALPTRAQPRLPTATLLVGPRQLKAEIAVSDAEQRTGMMFRTSMAENEGMLFFMDHPQRAGFWMANCLIPLSLAYLDANGAILEIHDLKPGDTNIVASVAANVSFALETPRGWFERNQISPGIVVATPAGSLKSTFFGRP